MKTVTVSVTEKGYHPPTGLDLKVGEMEVTEEQAAELRRDGKTKKATVVAETPAPKPAMKRKE